MKTLIEAIRYLLQRRLFYIQEECKNYKLNPFTREVDYLTQLIKKLELLSSYVNKVALFLIAFAVTFFLIFLTKWLTALFRN